MANTEPRNRIESRDVHTLSVGKFKTQEKALYKNQWGKDEPLITRWFLHRKYKIRIDFYCIVKPKN